MRIVIKKMDREGWRWEVLREKKESMEETVKTRQRRKKQKKKKGCFSSIPTNDFLHSIILTQKTILLTFGLFFLEYFLEHTFQNTFCEFHTILEIKNMYSRKDILK